MGRPCTISNYIGFITDTFLAHKVERYNIKDKETISGNIGFAELVALLSHLGFSERRKGGGSHHVFTKEGSMENRYEIILYWSDEDNAFIAEVPELAGCMADGKDQVEALRNVQTVIGQWLETARELGREIPKPKGRLMYA